MLKKIGLNIILILILSSCFEVVEEVRLDKNGSGRLKFCLNLSQSKNEINTLMRLDSSSGYHIPTKNEIEADLNTVILTLKKTDGLTNVIIMRDYKNWIFELKADFKSTKNLENGLKNLYAVFLNNSSKSSQNKIGYDGKLFYRENTPLQISMRRRLNKPTEKKIFAKAKYITIYHFESKIESCSNKRANLSPSKKAVMLSSNILNIINQKESIDNKIKLHAP